jgi:hypothetical protein
LEPGEDSATPISAAARATRRAACDDGGGTADGGTGAAAADGAGAPLTGEASASAPVRLAWVPRPSALSGTSA